MLDAETPELLADAVVVAVPDAVFEEELVDVVEPVVVVEVLLLDEELPVVVVKVAETVELVPDASETSKFGDWARMPVFCCSLEMRLIW